MSKSERVILVSGSNGGIGADVVEYLFECGHRNIACQHRSSPDRIGRVLEKLGLDPANDGAGWKKLYIDILDDLKIRDIRLIAYWDKIEPKEGEFDFHRE